MRTTTASTKIDLAVINPSNEIPSGQLSTLYKSSHTQGWCGRCVSVATDGLSTISQTMIGSLQSTLQGLHLITSDSNAIAGMFRKLDQHVLRFCEHLAEAKDSLSRCALSIRSQVAFIDFVQVAGDVYYFGCGKFREQKNEAGKVVKPKDDELIVAARVSLGLANLGGAFLWLEEMGALSLSKAAAAIGEVRLFNLVPKAVSSVPVLRDMTSLQSVAKSIGEFKVFGFVTHVSCLSLVLRGLDLGHALLAIEASNRLAVASNDAQLISASLDLTAYLSELVLSAMVFAGVTNVVGLGLAGLACLSLAASGFIYRITHDKEINQKPLLVDIKV